jgi:hypothetical protein
VESAVLRSPADLDLRALLSEVQTKAIRQLHLSGRTEEVAQAIVALRLSASSRQGDATDSLALAASMTLGKEYVRQVIAALPAGAEAKALPRPSASEDVVVARAVRKAVTGGDRAFLEQLGARAVPGLAEIALELDGSPIPEGQLDPLEELCALDPRAALDAGFELSERGEFLLTSLVARILAARNTFNSASIWRAVGPRDRVLLDPRHAVLLERTVNVSIGDDERLQDLIRPFIDSGALPASLRDRVLAWSTGPAPRLRLYGMASSILPEGSRWLFEAMLDSDDVDLRSTGVRAFLVSLDPAPAFRLTNDPDERVRKELARALRQRNVQDWTDEGRVSRRNRRVLATYDDAYRRSLKALLLDPSDSISAEALNSVRELVAETGEVPFPVDELVRDVLARVPDVERLRNMLILGDSYGPEGFERVLTWAVSNGPMESARKKRLHDLACAWAAQELDLPALERFAEAVQTHNPNDPPNGMAVAERMADLLDPSGDPTPLVVWLGYVDHPETWRVSASNDGLDLGRPWIARATDAQRVAVSAGVLQGKNLLPRNWDDRLDDSRVEIGGPALAALLGDRDASDFARAWALHRLCQRNPEAVTPDLDDAVIHLFADCTHTLRRQASRDLYDCDSDELRRRSTLLAIGRDDFPEWVLKEWLMYLDTPELLQAALDRCPPTTWAAQANDPLPRAIVRAIGRGDDRSRDDLLLQANIKDSRIQEAVVEGIESRRLPEHFEILRAVIENQSPGGGDWEQTLDAIAGYLDQPAAELLLATARTAGYPMYREEVFKRLNSVQSFLEAAAYWETRGGAAEKKARAVDRLVELSGDASQPVEVRAQALRGLGLLGAVDELPRLIEILGQPAVSDDVKVLQAAAREAIERLHGEQGEDRKGD